MKIAATLLTALALSGCAGIREDGSVSFEGWRTGRAAATGYVYTNTNGRQVRWAVGEQCRIDRSTPCLTSLPR